LIIPAPVKFLSTLQEPGVGFPFTATLGFLFTVTLGFLFTIALGFQLTISMPTKSFARVSAAVLGLALVLALVPGLDSAEKPRASLMRHVKQPGLFLTSIFPWLGHEIQNSPFPNEYSSKLSQGRVRPTNDTGTTKPGGGD